jgi:hypothetical protein
MRRVPALVIGAAVAFAGGYIGLVTGALAPDLNIGRRTRPLGPQRIDIDAPRNVVFDIIAAPYQQTQPRAFADKVRVLERGADIVLAAHRTPVRGRLVATTVETVRFSRPDRVDFRLVRGPVPHVVERFVLTARDGLTTLTYEGELGTDLWSVGARWGDIVAVKWERVVAATFASVKTEAERRAVMRRSTST